jgi:hypothetical protein
LNDTGSAAAADAHRKHASDAHAVRPHRPAKLGTIGSLLWKTPASPPEVHQHHPDADHPKPDIRANVCSVRPGDRSAVPDAIKMASGDLIQLIYPRFRVGTVLG